MSHQIKALVRERDGYCCTRCGLTDEQSRQRYGRTLDVHRVVPGSPYTVAGAVTLCQGCHLSLHRVLRPICPGRRRLNLTIKASLRRALKVQAVLEGQTLSDYCIAKLTAGLAEEIRELQAPTP
jgi:hypothetical protein